MAGVKGQQSCLPVCVREFARVEGHSPVPACTYVCVYVRVCVCVCLLQETRNGLRNTLRDKTSEEKRKKKSGALHGYVISG